MKIIIISNGTFPSRGLLQSELSSNAIIICADGGANYFQDHEVIPHYVIGDFDSISAELLQTFKSRQVTIEQHPQEKDHTDSELALQKAIDLGATEIIFLGCLGGSRVDHLLANLGMLEKCLNLGISAVFKDDVQVITIIDKPTKLFGIYGEYFSLQAYGTIVKNLNIVGAKYNLQNYDLKISDAKTISNEFVGNEVAISFTAGKLLIIRSIFPAY
jgi:thiamine pyrophosphokinase